VGTLLRPDILARQRGAAAAAITPRSPLVFAADRCF
jgi:hypothetical protein